MFLAIGYGNTLRGDDAVGRRVVDALEASRDDFDFLAKHLECVFVECLTPELAEPVSASSGVIFVDAREGGVPGDVRLEDVVEAHGGMASSHGLEPAVLLGIAGRLHGRRPRAVLLTVAGESFELSEDLSAAVAGAIPEVVRLVHERILAWTAEDRLEKGGPGDLASCTNLR
jgi:hydrogenase maturation protease